MVSFRNDLERIARRQLADWDVSTLLLTGDEVVTRFFVLQHRLLDPGPYSVHLSTRAASALVLASPEERKGMLALLRKATTREVMWPHQSRGLLARSRLHLPRRRRRAEAQHDGLFNDWGIQHLHLGVRTERGGFVERTGTLAFVMARGSDLFIIDFGPHPPASNWSDLGWLEIVEAHWPEQLTAMSYILPGKGPFGGTDHQRMRDAGVVTCVTLRSGRTLAPPGGGYSTSGHATKAMMRMDRVRQGLHHLEQMLTGMEAELRAALKCTDGDLDLHLDLDAKTGFEVSACGKRLKNRDGRRLPALCGL